MADTHPTWLVCLTCKRGLPLVEDTIGEGLLVARAEDLLTFAQTHTYKGHDTTTMRAHVARYLVYDLPYIVPHPS